MNKANFRKHVTKDPGEMNNLLGKTLTSAPQTPNVTNNLDNPAQLVLGNDFVWPMGDFFNQQIRKVVAQRYFYPTNLQCDYTPVQSPMG